MSKADKLLTRALSIPSDFTWEEATTLLRQYGFERLSAGKTGGSRRKFFNPETKGVICLHEPHPKPILCKPALKQLIEKLKENNCICEEEVDDRR